MTSQTTLAEAPALPYRPPVPQSYRPRIGLIGCGGITKEHLNAYRLMGYEVVAFCDINESAAEERRREYFPKARLYNDHRALLDQSDIDVVDIATHPAVRVPQVFDALAAGKHVLSQKPFVLDLADGEKLVAEAKRAKRLLAVNQNGRWAPYFSYLRAVVAEGLIGKIGSCDMAMAWDHSWIKGTAFERLHHIILYDFAIHWFDMVACVFSGRTANSVYAHAAVMPDQPIAPPLSAHALVEFENGQASLSFRGATPHTSREHVLVTGTQGLYEATGGIIAAHDARLVTASGETRPTFEGSWFPMGMAGAMGELLCAIEEDREPSNSAANNLPSLALCFAALESARTGRPVRPGEARIAGPGCSTE